MYTYKAKVVHIVDGDTVDLDIDLGFYMWLHKKRIRLEGIDTPEVRTTDLTEKVYGILAKNFVEDYIPVGTEVVVTTSLGDKDKFGRVIGTIYLNPVVSESFNKNLSINQLLLDNHLAVQYEGQSKEKIREAHLKNREILKSYD